MGQQLGPDTWAFILDDARFVQGFHKIIDEKILIVEDDHVRWNKLLPIKININSWRILKERLPTRANLETELHLFTKCSVALEVWKAIASWWKLRDLKFNNLLCNFSISESFSASNRKCQKFLDAVAHTALWVLW